MNTTALAPPIRLAFSRLFWRLAAGWLVLFAVLVGRLIARRVPPGRRAVAFLFFMPRYAAIAFSLAAGLTVVADLVVRLLVRPRLLAWQAPRVEPDAAPFHLEPGERPLLQAPARMRRGRGWAAGRLFHTDRRLLFLPAAWDVEPWEARRGEVTAVRTVPPPPLFWGLIRGLPERLEVAGPGRVVEFALADAGTVASRLGSDGIPAMSPIQP